MKNNRFNLLDKKFTNLTVIEFIGIVKGHRHWKCKCDCGNEITVRGASLTHNNTKSCGCLQEKIVGDQFRKHGKSRSAEYKSWQHVKDRCLNPNDPAYKDYGARGITVCDEWKNSFEKFFEDIGKCPKGLTIDRIDNEKGYYKENCRWITRKAQNLNKRNNLLITYKGITKTLTEFCNDLNLNYFTILKRIYKHKWSIEDALEIDDCKNRNKPKKELKSIKLKI